MASNRITKSQKNALRVLEALPSYDVVVEDGSWVRRFASRLVDPACTTHVAQEALLDDEVANRVGMLGVLSQTEGIPKQVVAAMLREVWLDSGISAEPEILTRQFRLALEAKESLMTAEEILRFHALPKKIIAYRGQIYDDGTEEPTGASWTLSKEVAGWYAAPVEFLNQPMGWVLKANVPKEAVLAFFQERGESELVLDLTMLDYECIEAKRGTCHEFPKHLARAR